MSPGVFQHHPLLLGRRLVRRHRLGRRPRTLPRPLTPPTVITPHRYAQRRQRLRHRPTTPLLGQLDFLVDTLLQFRRQLTVIFYSENVFFRSKFSAVISAITDLNRSFSRIIRFSAKLALAFFSSKITPADASNCFFHP